MSLATLGAVSAATNELPLPDTSSLSLGEVLILSGGGGTTEAVVIRSIASGRNIGATVSRGALGTLRLAHATPTTVTVYDPSGGVGGGGVTIEVPPAAPVAVTNIVAPGADVSTPGSATLAGIYVADNDPGAVGAKQLWLQTDPDGNFNTLQLWVRNAANDGWFAAAAGSSYSDTDLLDAGFWEAVSGRAYGALTINANAGTGIGLVVHSDPTVASTIRSVGVDETGVRITHTATAVYVIAGTLDPSAGAGVVAGPGSTYHRNNGGTGELWVKTGAGNTAWSKVTTS